MHRTDHGVSGQVETETERDRNTVATDTAVRAAGAVLWRWGRNGREIAVVHRPRYDDWTLPKGKLDPGELPPHAAVREVHEETGLHCVLSRFLTQVNYLMPRHGSTIGKLVDYFAAEADAGSFVPNEEVDELRWVSPEQARTELSYTVDIPVLDAFERLPTDTVTLLLVRHADAGKRADWPNDDALRPLNETGHAQREALRGLLSLFSPARVHSAPRVRCTETVAPLAERVATEIVPEPLFSEEDYAAAPQAGVDRLLHVANGSGTAVVCSQGGVIPDLVGRLAATSGVVLDSEISSRKGSVWSLVFTRDANSPNGNRPPLRLISADYFADARG